MGSTESRIEQGPAAPEPVQGGDTKVSLTMSSRLSSSLGGQQELQRTYVLIAWRLSILKQNLHLPVP